MLLSCMCAWQSRAATGDFAFFDPNLGDLQGDLQAARSQGKMGMLIMFEMDECPYCRRMKETVFPRPDVQTFFRQHFVIIAVDVLGDVKMRDPAGHELREKDFARSMGATATPTFVFFDLDGRVLVRHVGATRDAKSFLRLGHYVVEGAYKNKSFAEYLRAPS
ncbi:MAG: thioredoxin family protein [Rhodocyclaceae bacterium]|nr:thioredoxin family protein [Rhodocyclaceae bacterium]